MRESVFPAAALLFLPLILLAGCGLSERPYPLINTYTLEVPEGAGEAGSVTKRPKAVLIVTASPPPAAYDGKKLVYRLKPHELTPDFYNEFYTPPSRAIADSLASYLDRRSPDLQIVRFQGASSPDYSLEVGITDFYGDYSVSPPVLRLTLSATLVDLRKSAPKNLSSSRWTKTPELRPAPGENRPENLVRQMIEALSELYPEILAEVEGALKTGR
jgi:uncharacterized lipoprotein YmbA